MLIRFSVENFLSFKEKTSLEMFASKNRTPKNQVIDLKRYDIPKLLKSAFVFGPNASGKSNLILALDYSTSIVLEKPSPAISSQRILPFRLDKEYVEKPSSFEFEFVIEKRIYKYGFSIKEDIISFEYLYQIKTMLDELIFERKYDEGTKNVYKYGTNYAKWEDDINRFIADGTPKNKLFLVESVQRNQDDFKDIYNWFKKILIIYPKSKLARFDSIVKNDKLIEILNQVLLECSTGISEVKLEKIKEELFWEKVPEPFKKGNNPGKLKSISLQADNRYIMINSEKESNAYRIVINHDMPGSDEVVEFNINEESEGTNRLFDLVPLFLELMNDRIVIIDELERSLHPLLTKYWVELFFKLNKESKGQLIVASHSMILLNVKLIRRDSIWFINKNQEMSSVLYSLVEYTKVRNDKELQKAYLLGLYGAVPLIRKGE